VIEAYDGQARMRYHATMKKIPQKLVLRSETLRVLTNMDLERVVGGIDSGAKQCLAVPDTGDKACTSTAAVVSATAACR